MHRYATATSLVLATALLSGCGGNNEQAGTDTSTPQNTMASATATSSSPSNAMTSTSAAPSGTGSASTSSADASGPIDLADHKFPVSWQDALKTAQDKFDGEVSKIELEQSDTGTWEYKIELLSDTQKYAMQEDANSGEVLAEKTDDFDGDKIGSERQKKRLDMADVVSLDEAMNAALGTHDGPINKWKLEGKDSGAQYEFDIDKNDNPQGDDYEVQVDAKSGKVTQQG